MITIPADGSPISQVELLAPPDGATIHNAVGGYFEMVPHLSSLQTQHGVMRCVAFCNEDGKRDMPLAINMRANEIWHDATMRQLGTTPHPDYLVGPVVILIGDDEFMEAL